MLFFDNINITRSTRCTGEYDCDNNCDCPEFTCSGSDCDNSDGWQ